MPYSRIRSELNQLTGNIWDDVTLVRGTPGPWQLGEVTVTQMLHLRLLQSGLLTGLVHYNVPHEPTTGADWEWFVQLPHRGRPSPNRTPSYLHYRIQAKILSTSTARRLKFAEINHNGGRQRATLLSAARAVGAIPYYAFYIGDPWPTTNPIKLPTWRGVRPRRHFGCTAVPAPVVDAIHANAGHGSRTAANQYLEHSTPRWGMGRRLADLFPIPPSRAGGSPWSPVPPDPPTGGTTHDEPSDDRPRSEPPVDGQPTEMSPQHELPSDPQQVYGESPNSERLAGPLSEEMSGLLAELRGLGRDGRAPVMSLPADDQDHQLRMTAFITLDDPVHTQSAVASATHSIGLAP